MLDVCVGVIGGNEFSSHAIQIDTAHELQQSRTNTRVSEIPAKEFFDVR